MMSVEALVGEVVEFDYPEDNRLDVPLKLVHRVARIDRADPKPPAPETVELDPTRVRDGIKLHARDLRKNLIRTFYSGRMSNVRVVVAEPLAVASSTATNQSVPVDEPHFGGTIDDGVRIKSSEKAGQPDGIREGFMSRRALLNRVREARSCGESGESLLAELEQKLAAMIAADGDRVDVVIVGDGPERVAQRLVSAKDADAYCSMYNRHPDYGRAIVRPGA